VGWRYRFWQFWNALTAKPDERDLIFVEEILSPSLIQLFYQMSSSEQAHALRVCKVLLHQGEREPELLAAALLHDIGKSLYPLRIWERVWIVLYHRFLAQRFPGAQFRTGKDGQRSSWWARPLVIASQHPEWGAQMLEEKGASPVTVWLVRNHQEPIEKALDGRAEEMLEMLRRADQVS